MHSLQDYQNITKGICRYTHLLLIHIEFMVQTSVIHTLDCANPCHVCCMYAVLQKRRVLFQ
jgi:hypothetical protein